MAREYKHAMDDMVGRAPGDTTMTSTRQLRPDQPGGCLLPFNYAGGGCGAAMRCSSIGLVYWREQDLDDLVTVAVASGQLTHNQYAAHRRAAGPRPARTPP